MTDDKDDKKPDGLSKSTNPSMKAVAALKTRRTVCESQIQRACEFLEKIDNNVNITSIPELTIRLSALEEAFKTFQGVQTKLEEKDPDELGNGDRSSYEEMYFQCASGIKVLITQMEEPRDTSFNNSTTDDSFNKVKLPRIELHTFSGEITAWMSWYEEFHSLVHTNPHLSTLTKFHHLVSKLEGSAKATIDGLKIVNDNYEVALQRLRERFENKKIIGKKHIEHIFQHPKLEKPNATQLRHLIDSINNLLSGLKNLKRPVEHWDDLIVHIITSKLDSQTALKWNEESATDRLSTLNEMMIFLKKRCQILENNQESHVISNTSGSNYSDKKHKKSFVTTKLICNFCHQSGHYIYRCNSFLNLLPLDRLNRIRDSKLCQNCLRNSNHNSYNYQSNYKCKFCGKNHHSLLHIENSPSLPSNNSKNSEVAPNIQSMLPTNNNTGVFHNKSTTNTILGTAVIYLIVGHSKIPCRALLDSGSQLNIITDRITKNSLILNSIFQIKSIYYSE